MTRNNYKQRIRRRKVQSIKRQFPFLLLGILVVGVIGSGVFILGRQIKKQGFSPASASISSQELQKNIADRSESSDFSAETSIQVTIDAKVEVLLADAKKLADGYDYDAAIALLQADSAAATDQRIIDAIASYEETKTTLVEYDVSQVTHVFFHTLIMDNQKAFDGDAREAGYNQVMTTKSEFEKIIQSMYDRGYVLVRLHDIASEVTAGDGTQSFVKGSIMLPEGKKAFVMSQDDVCYYEYMEGDGFASRMIIGEDGKPTCEMKMDDGTISVGSYDLVPILEDFIQKHPDFSYKGARAVIAFTGYNGILGYRTAASYMDSPTYEEDRAAAAAVAQCLRDNGWELASHSWGHRNMGSISYDAFKTDTDKWEAEVESLIGPTDIILFPFGSDVGDWHPYTDSNERFRYLKSVGFRYFCNVDSAKYWVQIGQDHMRQGRRNLDGYRMYYDMVETDPTKQKLSDLFDVAQVFDPDRPTPVPPMGG